MGDHTTYWTDWKDPRVHLFLLVGSLLLIFISVSNKTPTELVTEQSTVAAFEFLHMVDAEEYAQSWEDASAMLQNMLTKKAWMAQLSKIREMTGPILERTHDKISYTDEAINAPPGEYVVISFVSKFAFKGYVIETITLLLDKSGHWLVAGYFLK